MHYHTIIVGAGPAGLFAAQALGQHRKSVLVLERNKRAGRKLLVSGAGQCNFTHDGPIEHFLECYHNQAKFIKKALFSFTNKDTMRFFESLDVPYQVFPNQKVFPKSMKSEDVLGALLKACQKGNVQIEYGQTVGQISIYDGVYTIETEEGKRYFSDHVVIATGGKSYAPLGSDGKGYEIAQSLGHTIITPRPALTDVRLRENPYKPISGVSVQNAELTLWRQNKKLVRRIIEEQEDFPWMCIPGLNDPRHYFVKDLYGKGVEEVASIDFRGNFIFFRPRQYKVRFYPRNGSFPIFQGTLIDTLIIFDPNGLHLCPIGQEKANTSLPAAIV